MELLNATKMQAGYTMGLAPDGRESLVVVVKGTFRIPEEGGVAELAEEQAPLVMADVFSGEPGLSAPIYESDYVPKKPKCDVLLNGTAYAPGGQQTTQVVVSLQIGSMAKSFAVVGKRNWQKSLFSVKHTEPEPFTCMPITYSQAFGGADTTHEDPAKHKFFLANPIGIGFHQQLKSELIDGKPLPNTEEIDNPITYPSKPYKPMSFGPVGRNWDPRFKFAGTYDQAWIDNVFPFLPADFDEAYYQTAPSDQQIPFLEGGEEIFLRNLTPEGVTQFNLPSIDMPMVFFPKKGEKRETKGVIDTLIIEPDQQRFMMTWRASYPLKRNMFEVAQVVTGVMPNAWYRARELGKTYYPSLGVLAAAKGEGRNEDE